MVFACGHPGTDDTVEVLGVFGDDGPHCGAGPAQELFVGERCQLRIVSCCLYVVAVHPQTFGGDTGVVHVEEELHPASTSWRRRHAASASSAAFRFAAISSSISAVNDA